MGKSGRKISRKTEKEKKLNRASTVGEGNEVNKFFIIIAVLMVIIIVFYGISYLVTKKSDKKASDSEATIQYSEIIIGNLLNREEAEYYVLATREKDAFTSLYLQYLTMYQSKDGALKYYTLNLNSVFNKAFLAENSVFAITNISDIRFADSTLLKISNGTISENYVGKDAIVAALRAISL